MECLIEKKMEKTTIFKSLHKYLICLIWELIIKLNLALIKKGY